MRATSAAALAHSGPPLDPLHAHALTLPTTLAAWHEVIRLRDGAALDRLLADDVAFHSRVVHAPQRGKAITAAYLSAAMRRPLKAVNLVHQRMGELPAQFQAAGTPGGKA